MASRITRKKVALPAALKNLLHDLLQEATQLQSTDIQLAADKTAAAWALVPEPRFNTNCTLMVLNDHVQRLLEAGRIHEASNIAGLWVAETESRPRPVYEMRAYILFAASLMHLQKPAEAKIILRMIYKYGAKRADFKGLPVLYWDLFCNPRVSDEVVMERFREEVVAPAAALPTQEPFELHPQIVDRIQQQIDLGHRAFAEGNYEKAVVAWTRALKKIPSPKSGFGQSLALNASIGDAYFKLRDYRQARVYLEAAKANTAENGNTNAFVLMRLGEVMLELDERPAAREYMIQAYSIGGEQLFEAEETEYRNFLASCMKMAQG
ncbi:tetratricopeptide repeat protein [Chitinophaga qingshengii]|uniref:Tetratricopeptide repeat protein n=1 Tax=Chitinophaga qingshengii TaxID=1569794 RepID=A0ABR7TR06_9BACT|nr:hypothetical protein [Chitinophaga qingshengii]MBC9932917.1 hypothetical protein [Chitinophaga qingshengii]